MEISNFEQSFLKGGQEVGLDQKTQDPGDDKISNTESSENASLNSSAKERRKK